jgi:cysteine-rich repeat protein
MQAARWWAVRAQRQLGVAITGLVGALLIASAAGAVHLDVGSASGAPGESVTFSVSLDSEGEMVTGIQLDISFDPLTTITGCMPGGVLRPIGCTPGVDCTVFRFLQLSTGPLPDGTNRTCTVDISAAAPDAVYPLTCSNQGASDASGTALPTTCSDGAITVVSPVCGNAIAEFGEVCDTGTTPIPDCCSATCTYEPDGFLCDDGDPVTSSQCLAGACVTSIGAKKLLLRTPRSGPDGNALALVSDDTGLEAPQSPGEDPRCPPLGTGMLVAGATLSVDGLGGSFSIALPCVNWSANGAGTRYRYRDATGATCKSVLVQDGRLRALCKGPQVAYALGAAQSEVQVSLATGDSATARRYCFTFGPSTATVVRDGTNGRNYKAVNSVPGVCP